MLARVDFANVNTIAAVSIAVGVGFNNSNLFNSLPTEFSMFFKTESLRRGHPAVVLNATFNQEANK